MTTSIPPDYAPAPDLLAGRAILVTGAAAGIGRALARACAAHGAEVLLLDRALAELEALHDEIVETGARQPAICPVDLRGLSPHDADDLAQRLAAEFGRLDGLVHCAAVLGALCPIEHYEPAEWLEVVQVNLNAAFVLTRACLPMLRRAPRGRHPHRRPFHPHHVLGHAAVPAHPARLLARVRERSRRRRRQTPPRRPDQPPRPRRHARTPRKTPADEGPGLQLPQHAPGHP